MCGASTHHHHAKISWPLPNDLQHKKPRVQTIKLVYNWSSSASVLRHKQKQKQKTKNVRDVSKHTMRPSRIKGANSTEKSLPVTMMGMRMLSFSFLWPSPMLTRVGSSHIAISVEHTIWLLTVLVVACTSRSQCE